MATHTTLVTGGAGFIGSHLSTELLRLGHQVKILDSLEPQVHGNAAKYAGGAEFLKGDTRDPSAWQSALKDVAVVFHEAAAVGVAQSMYQIRRYVEVNTLGTANLLELLANRKHDVRKLVVASSNTIYGEGAYSCPRCGVVYPGLRSEADLKKGLWEPRCPRCRSELSRRPTSEEKPLNPTSIYATTKRDQEEMCLQVGKAYGIPTVVLRYFSVYGPGQSLSNPYTGVCAIFSSRIKAGKPPVIYEDGKQTRDFVSVKDVVRANLLAMKKRSMSGQSFNVATGTPTSVLKVAHTIADALGTDIRPQVTGQYRGGDIRHCYADISRIASHGFRPKVCFEEGMKEFIGWAQAQKSRDRFEQASSELERRGLVSGGRDA